MNDKEYRTYSLKVIYSYFTLYIYIILADSFWFGLCVFITTVLPSYLAMYGKNHMLF